MSLKSDGKLDLEDLWSDEIDKGLMPKEKKQESEPNKPPQKGENNMKKNRFKKIYILIAVYILIIVTELFFCVPYQRMQIFVSNQNVPHTEIVGSGYATMTDITDDYAYLSSNQYTSNTGKRVNTPQLFMNVSITTILALGLYFLLQKNEKVKEMPELDVNSLAFATEEEVKQAQRDYARKMYHYVKGKEFL